MKRFLTALFAAVTSVLSLSAGAQDKFVLSTQASASAQFAGYYVAQEKGFYQEEGLSVELVHPYVTQAVADVILKDSQQAAILPLSLAMRLVDSGLPLVNILQTSMNSATVIISRWGADPMTLRGAKVATSRAGFGQSARSYAELEHLNYQWIPTASAVDLFISGAVEATLGRSYDEYYRILQTGLVRSETAVYRFENGPYNIQQEGVYVTRSYQQSHPDAVERFARASRAGWEWAAAHPEETLDIVMRYVKLHRIETNRTLQQLMLAEVLRLQMDPDSGQRAFRLRPDMVDKANDLMQGTGLLKRRVTFEELMP